MRAGQPQPGQCELPQKQQQVWLRGSRLCAASHCTAPPPPAPEPEIPPPCPWPAACLPTCIHLCWAGVGACHEPLQDGGKARGCLRLLLRGQREQAGDQHASDRWAGRLTGGQCVWLVGRRRACIGRQALACGGWRRRAAAVQRCAVLRCAVLTPSPLPVGGWLKCALARSCWMTPRITCGAAAAAAELQFLFMRTGGHGRGRRRARRGSGHTWQGSVAAAAAAARHAAHTRAWHCFSPG